MFRVASENYPFRKELPSNSLICQKTTSMIFKNSAVKKYQEFRTDEKREVGGGG